MKSKDTPIALLQKLGEAGQSPDLIRGVRKRVLKERALLARKANSRGDNRREETGDRWDDERATAEEWYAERRRKEDLSSAMIAANQRRDHLLPEDER